MTAFPEEQFVEWVQDLHRMIADKVISQGQQISGWLVVGNAAALVIAFNGTIQGTTCDVTLVREAVRLFATGLCFAFVACVVGYAGNLWNLLFITDILTSSTEMYANQFHIRELVEKGLGPGGLKDSYDRAGVKLKTLGTRKVWIVPIIALTLFVSSLICFARALLLPVGGSGQIFASCAARAHLVPSPPIAPSSHQR